jgi:hypothetical protein
MKILILNLIVLFLAVPILHGAEDGVEKAESDRRLLSFNKDAPQNKDQMPSSAPILAPAGTVLPMTNKEKFDFYLKSTFDPQSFFSSAASAGIRQAMDSVPEWGQGMEGYGKRFGSSFGQKVIHKTVVFGFGAILREDPRYYKSEDSRAWRRLIHAVGQSFIAHKDSGGIRPAYSSFIGTTAGVCISRQWYPQRKQTASEYFKDGAITFSAGIAKNIISEFWLTRKNASKR